MYIYIYITRHPGFAIIFGPWDRKPDSPIMGPGSSNLGSFFDRFLGPIWTPRNVKIHKKCGFAGFPKRIPQKDTFL